LWPDLKTGSGIHHQPQCTADVTEPDRMKGSRDTAPEIESGTGLQSKVDLNDHLSCLIIQAGILRLPDQKCKILCSSDSF
jgi:hypothetical protein